MNNGALVVQFECEHCALKFESNRSIQQSPDNAVRRFCLCKYCVESLHWRLPTEFVEPARQVVRLPVWQFAC